MHQIKPGYHTFYQQLSKMKNFAAILAIISAGRSPASAIINAPEDPLPRGTRNYLVSIGQSFNPSGGLVLPNTPITNYKARCGGTIISPRAILTAAREYYALLFGMMLCSIRQLRVSSNIQ